LGEVRELRPSPYRVTSVVVERLSTKAPSGGRKEVGKSVQNGDLMEMRRLTLAKEKGRDFKYGGQVIVPQKGEG